MECKITDISNEELLKELWHQSEDINRKREISAQLYKLKENRLENLYQGKIMSGTTSDFGKDPLTTRHGESLADQSFQSLKSKEVRDSMSPTHDIKFHSLALNQPNSSGWNVNTSSEVSPDGRSYHTETVASTDGVENVNGGIAEFQGRNEQRSSASEVGDDKNFVKKSAESSNTHLQEKVVIGDENSGRLEMKTSSTTSSSSKKVVSSSSTVEYGTDASNEKYVDNSDYNKQQIHNREHKKHDQHQQNEDHYHHDRSTQERKEQYSNEYQTKRSDNTNSEKYEHTKVHEQSKRVVDLEKSSPEYQQHVQYLMSQPGEVLSNTVEYPKPNVKMITTVKRLPDGTIVKNKRYETEASASEAAQYHNSTATNKQSTTDRRSEDRKTAEEIYKGFKKDDVDNIKRTENLQTKMDSQYFTNENLTKSFKTLKESNESSSKTFEEYNDRSSGRYTNREESTPKDFSTHGFPSVRADKATQEFPTDHPRGARPVENVPTSHLQTNADGEVIVVSKKSHSTIKQKTNSERIVESEVIVDDNNYPSHTSTHHFTTSCSPSKGSQRTTYYADHDADITTHGFPSVRPEKLTQQFTSHRPQSEMATDKEDAFNLSNNEHIINTRIESNREYEASEKRSTQKPDFSTQGFPSVRSPTKTPEYATKSYATNAEKSPTTSQTTPQNKYASGVNKISTKSPVVTPSSVKLIQKEREVDANHRAFAASLRSDSPVDTIRRDSFPDHSRQSPRSSISSAKTYRRDTREGSHDSAAPSETSRFSSSTVTRQSPNKSPGKTVVTKQMTSTFKSRNVKGSNETIDLTSQRSTKSPSPMKTTTRKTASTATTKTSTTTPNSKLTNDVPNKPDNLINKPAVKKNSSTINEPLTIQKKTHFSTNALKSTKENPVVEAPCIKKHFYQLGQSENKKSLNLDEKSKIILLNRPQQQQKHQQSEDIGELISGMLESVIEEAGPSKKISATNSKSPQHTDKKHMSKIYLNKSENICEMSKQSPSAQCSFNIRTPHHLKEQSPIRDLKDNNVQPISEKIHQSDFNIVIETDINNTNKNNTHSNDQKRTGVRPNLVKNTDKTHQPNLKINESDNNIKMMATTEKDNLQVNKTTVVNKNNNEEQEVTKTGKYLKEMSVKTNTKEEKVNKLNPETSFILDENLPVMKNENTIFIEKETNEFDRNQVNITTENKTNPTQSFLEMETTRSINPKSFKSKINIKSNLEEDIKYVSPSVQAPRSLSRESSPLKSVIDIFEQEQDDKKSPINKSQIINTNSRKVIHETDNKSKSPRAQSPAKIYQPTKLPVTNQKSEKSEVISTKLTSTISKTEAPDGALISKYPEPAAIAPTSPTYKKKGVGPRETFEDRCRQILGMEQDGTTHGQYRTVSEEKEVNNIKKTNEKSLDDISLSDVTIEDCVDDDSLPYEKPILLKNKQNNEEEYEDYSIRACLSKPKLSENAKLEENACSSISSDESVKTVNEMSSTTETENFISKKMQSQKEKNVTEKTFKIPQIVRKPLVSKTVANKNTRESNTRKTENIPELNLTGQKNSFTVSTKKDEKDKQECKLKIQGKRPSFEQPKISASSKKGTKTKEISNNVTTTKTEESIKERLRSSTKKQLFKDNTDSRYSPETSPTRLNERRRSSNISVHTEIIIDHTSPKSPSQERKLSDSKYTSTRSIVNKPNQKHNVTERKETAPVNRVTPKEKAIRISRATTEEIATVNGKPKQKPVLNSPKIEKRPNKCLSTKSINLQSNIPRNEELDSIAIVDIRHAKSSREPSPDKIIPIPVPDHIDIGESRFPDIVQEPEDQPKKRPIVTNIPIFEEEFSDYVGCQISEVSIDRMSQISDDILVNPTVEAPQSLEYTSIDKPDDDCLLTVVEKVSKFKHSADEVTKTKASSPFNREFDVNAMVSQDDECLLSVDEKVSKFLKTAEEVTKPITPVREIEKPKFENFDEELQSDNCTLSVSQKVTKFSSTADKLKPTSPQRSPDLVARMERHISRQSEPDNFDDDETEDDLKKVSFVKDFKETEKIEGNSLEIKYSTNDNITKECKGKQSKLYEEEIEELVPMSKTHTTAIELKRQKDILSRPSVFKSKPIIKKQSGRRSSEDNENKFKTSQVNTIRSQLQTSNIAKSNNQEKQKFFENVTETSSNDEFENLEEIEIKIVEDVESDNEELYSDRVSSRKDNNQTKNEISHSPLHNNKSTKSQVTQITERTIKHPSTVSKPNDNDLEKYQNKKVLNLISARSKDTSSESVAARRNIFEKNVPQSPTQTRRPSYMEHTKSSLEHTRRDSLELNKTNCARKSVLEDDLSIDNRPNVSVKFEIPQYLSQQESTEENIKIEEIFDLKVLEELLEEVISYELRRRIRAQIRLVKKNMTSSEAFEKRSSETNKTFTTYSSKKHREETDTISDDFKPSKKPELIKNEKEKIKINEKQIIGKPRDRSHSSSLKEVRRDSDTMSTKSQYFSREEKSDYSKVQESHESTTKSRNRSVSPEMKTSRKTTHHKSPVGHQSRNIIETKQEFSTSKSVDSKSPILERKPNRNKNEEKPPVWAERKNVLKSTSNSVRKAPVPAMRVPTTTKSRHLKSGYESKVFEEDSIISSYGIGPTDENGIPLFGIRALKTKKNEPSGDIKEKVTGYVIEEKFYSDNKSSPVRDRKEYIFSTDADELGKIKKNIESGKRFSKDATTRILHDDNEYIRKGSRGNSPDDELFATSSKYVRRGSVKELSEKLIRKESSQSITEKSNKYPKAGLILRTHSRSDTNESNDDCKSSPTHFDKTGDVESVFNMQSSSHIVTGNESETESVRITRKSSKENSSKTTRSFLNSSGESRKISGIDDVLERMRNADNVVEVNDTQEDQEARALLNKFLGASMIMSGVESAIPLSQTKTTKTVLYANDDDKHTGKVNSSRITTKTTSRSGNSSTPITHTTYCIEEIGNEKTLKDLLDKAGSYEERRKIRARLRELMAEREEKLKAEAGKTVAPIAEAEIDESSASEYEEIIEEITDDSEEEELEIKENSIDKKNKEKESVIKNTKLPQDEKNVKEETTELTKSESKEATESISKTSSVDLEASVEKTSEITETSITEKGESLMPLLQDLLHTNMLQAKSAVQNSNISKVKKSLNTDTNTILKKQITCSENQTNNKMLGVRNNKTTNNKNTKDCTTIVTVTETAPTPTPSQSQSTKNNQIKVGETTLQVDRLSVPQKEDSGTESGEDFRLFAAGLREKLDGQNDRNIIEEVTTALGRLENSLREGKEISVDGNKRKALLALVERLQTGLTSPEKLAELATAMANINDVDYTLNESSSPENEGNRCNRQRFAKRRSRNSRHTVGVSREELADARRYMEDLILMENISNCTTPDSGLNAITPPQLVPIDRNTSSSNMDAQQSQQPMQLHRPNQFISNNNQSTTETKTSSTNKRRPLSGDFSVTFEPPKGEGNNIYENHYAYADNDQSLENVSPDSILKNARFSAKRQMMKRANTIDIAKTKKYHQEQETDSDTEEKGGNSPWGLKRAVEVSVVKKVRNVIPPFEPKTENDHKFLAFINKQAPKPGLAWNGTKSVSNWTNKFGNIKHTFEVGAAATSTTGKPPQVPGHIHQNAAKSYWTKQFPHSLNVAASGADYRIQKSQQEAAERQRRLEYERLERQRIELDRRLERERNRYEQERYERERLEREHFERQRYENERLQREHYERERLKKKKLEFDQLERERLEHENLDRLRIEKELLAAEQLKSLSDTPTIKPTPVNQFMHAPQSVFRPIENNHLHTPPLYKPIPQTPNRSNAWQPLSAQKNDMSSPKSMNAKHSYSTPYLNSPSPNPTSPIGLPWLSKPAVNNTDFRNKANMFEERSQNDNYNPSCLQRHNSLRTPKFIERQTIDYSKRPSLPNTIDPYMDHNTPYMPQHAHEPLSMPPPTNVSFTYTNYAPKNNYKSVPCLPTAVSSSPLYYPRTREDSLTNPAAVPLVLTSSNPLYSPQVDRNISSTHYSDCNSPVNSTSVSPGVYNMQQNDYTDDDLDSVNMTEYRVEAKVMAKPQGQTATTTTRRKNHMSDDESYTKNSKAAKSLLHTMKNLGDSRLKKINVSKSENNPGKTCLSPDGRAYQAPIVEPLFPQITNFETKRNPLYKENSMTSPVSSTSDYRPIPQHQVISQSQLKNLIDHAPRDGSINHVKTENQNLSQYVSETQNAYVVSYPSEESLNSISQDSSLLNKSIPPPPPTSLPLQRHRNLSENSNASSSISYNNLPSPNTNWTANPIAENIEETSRSYEKPLLQKNFQERKKSQTLKPDISPKPQLENQAPKNKANQVRRDSLQQKQESKPQTTTTTTVRIDKQKYSQKNQEVRTDLPAKFLNNVGNKRENQQLLSKRTHSEDAVGQSVLQFQNRVLSQQSLVTKQQQQIEQQQKIEEMRRKSLGNVLDVHQRKLSYIDNHKEIHEVYKSSAPPDTPDIVKSSLPKDDSMPILKKFGPPQRHLYIPNSYQNPLSSPKAKPGGNNSNTNTKRIVSSSKEISSSSIRREIVHNSSLSVKPAIKDHAGSPQPTEEYIPRNIVFNNINAFTSLSRKQDDVTMLEPQQQQMPRINRLSKCDSWNQIVQQQQQQQSSSTKINVIGSPNELRRTKSGHSLTVPKMYEAGIDKEEISEKQKTVAAYFSGNKSPNSQLQDGISTQMQTQYQQMQVSAKKSAINRTKTSEKMSASRKSLTSMTSMSSTGAGGLSRSATMPHIANINLLDESNVEDAFDQLMSATNARLICK